MDRAKLCRLARERFALADLSDRGKFRIVGSERASWFHGMSSNTVTDLAVGSGNYGTILTDRGKVVSDYRLIVRPEALFFDVEPNRRDRVAEHLNRFLISEDAELQDVSDDWALLHVLGPAAKDVLEEQGFRDLPDSLYRSGEQDGRMVVRMNRFGSPGYDLWVPRSEREALAEAIRSAGVPRVDAETLEVLRLESGIARCTVDFDETIIPLEAQLHHAISYTKGCYLGQEIVARMHFRGHPNKLLVGMTLSGQTVPPAKADLYAEPDAERRSGWITSAAYSPTLDRVVALGYVRRPLAEPGTSLFWRFDGKNVPVQVVETPLVGENEVIPEPE